MAGYWAKIISGAWTKTWQPLGWDRKKAALAVLTLCGIVTTFIQFGWVAMITTATGAFWTALPIALAALILFVWGIIETQAQLYAGLAESSATQVAKLEASLAKYQTVRPNYAAVRLQHQYALGAASRLWCDLDPNSRATKESESWYEAFVSAVQRGDLKFIPSHPSYPHLVNQEQRTPQWSTTVTRVELKRFAASINEDPPFLRDA